MVREQKKIGEFGMSIEDLAGLAGIEVSQARTILEKLASVRIIDVSGDKILIKNQEQVEKLVRYLEMREIFGEMS
jgi:hypothetical protein